MSYDPARHWIDGQWHARGPERATVEVATGRTHGRFHEGDAGIAGEAVAAARHTFERSAWAHEPRRRAATLLELADAIEARVEEIAGHIAAENGKVLADCVGETRAAVSEARYYAGLARAIFGRVAELGEGRQAILASEPIGVAAIVVPWNAPSTLLMRSLGPALATGCTVVLKGAHQTSSVNRLYAECLAACPSLPAGAVNVVHGDVEVAQTICQHREVDAVSFTGSSATGKAIMGAGAATLKRLSLELGGKAPAVVFADADMERAVREIRAGMIPHCGQMCTAIARILVAEAAYDAFVPRLAEALASVRVAEPFAEGAEMGPLFDAAGAERYGANIAEAEAAGEAILPGARLEGHPVPNFVRPALYRVEDAGHRLVQEELFAPIGLVETFGTEEEAAARANATRYGLAASVYSESEGRARRLARAIKAGTVWINCHNRLAAEAETGGFRESGLGRLHGLEGLSDFLETKTIYAEFGRLPGG